MYIICTTVMMYVHYIYNCYDVCTLYVQLLQCMYIIYATDHVWYDVCTLYR